MGVQRFIRPVSSISLHSASILSFSTMTNSSSNVRRLDFSDDMGVNSREDSDTCTGLDTSPPNLINYPAAFGGPSTDTFCIDVSGTYT